jgi:hypothetical protein
MVIQGKYVKGWYGLFSAERLRDEIMPKLVECSRSGYSYPFLITTHVLANWAEITIKVPPGLIARRSDIKFVPRKPKTQQRGVALVTGPEEARLFVEPDHVVFEGERRGQGNL